MSDRALERPEKTSAMLVEFRYGDATVLRFTDWTSAVVHLGRRYDPVPEMSIDLPANTGGIQESPLRITMPLNAFTNAISIGEPHARIEVTVTERIMAESDGLAKVHFIGTCDRATRNSQGRRERVRIEVVNVKQELKVACGIVATAQCAHIFGDQNCKKGVIALRETGTIVAIDGTVLTVEGLVHTLAPKYWHRGDVTIDGLAIKIRDYTVGNQMRLVKDPPRSWLGKIGTFTPGCDGEISTCRTNWANEENFLGLGYAMPAYHPLIEAE